MSGLLLALVPKKLAPPSLGYTGAMSEGPANSLQALLRFLDKLEEHHIYFTLCRVRSEAVMVRVDVPGERWEIEFFADGTIETEVFGGSTGVQSGDEPLTRLFRDFS